jgi:hypothetical protein
MDLHLHSPIRLQVIVFSEAKQPINRNFPLHVSKLHFFRTQKKIISVLKIFLLVMTSHVFLGATKISKEYNIILKNKAVFFSEILVRTKADVSIFSALKS